MKLPRGRVLRANSGGVLVPLEPVQAASSRPRRVARESVEATVRAHEILEAAEQRAAAIVAAAERDSMGARLRAEEVGRAEGLAQLAAVATRLADEAAQADERAVERVVELVRLVSERVIGESLEGSTERLVELARRAVSEARGARSIEVHAHPGDAAVLDSWKAELDPAGRVHAVIQDPSLSPGDLRIETEIGVLDARLGTQIGRLVERLRQVLHS